MATDIGYLHHVGHILRDMERALRVYRQLGFRCSHPAYPMLAPAPGERPVPLGAANTHAEFARNFIEIMSVVTNASDMPAEARVVELQVPPAARERVLESAQQTIAKISVRLSQFEGLHRLVFQTADIDATAARMDRDGVGHGDINVAQREVETPTGVRRDPVHVVEIDSDDVAEGQLAVADSPGAVEVPPHPNGALELVESILCVADPAIDECIARYSRYIGRDARPAGSAWSFELEGSCLRVLPASSLGAWLPGETPAALPMLAGYVVAVADLGRARALLEANGVPLRQTPTGDIFVPAMFALGATVIFRQKLSD